MKPSKVMGVDRAKGAWAVVVLDSGRFDHAALVQDLGRLDTTGIDCVAVDMPMVFPVGGRRHAEIEARKALGRRASTVFYTPSMSATERDWAFARSQGVSKQAWNLVPSISEVMTHADDRWIEVHPEVVFATLAGAPLVSKKTWDGSRARLRLLELEGVHIPNDVGSAGSAAPDDVVDAAVCALVASRHPDGTSPLGARETGQIWSLSDATA